MQRPFAARDTFPTDSEVKSSIAAYLARPLSRFASMLSLSKLRSWSIKSPSPRSFLLVSQSALRPRRVQTASIVVCTSGGGFANDLTSVMSPLVRELSADTAAFSAGRASSRSFWASSWMMRTPAANSSTSAASFDTVASTCAASALSTATVLRRISVAADFSLRTGSSTARSSFADPMTLPTSSIFDRPVMKVSSCSESSARLTPRRYRYSWIMSR
mmetsp:Transcript_48483/g.115378  ORF Transcript_48483/g.115378 Transcript_48483/m.115378 type:complete len:217 (+) Transcript_48483:595-1245(+)